MHDIIDALYLYAQETQVKKHLWTSEYFRAAWGLEEGWNDFRAALTEEQSRWLDSLLLQETEVKYLEDEASFQAGVSIGIELGRL